VCFNHQIKKCNGICNNEEEIEIYNKRAKKLVVANTCEAQNFMLMDRGRNSEEQSIILIENGNYKGYGYLESSMQFSSPNDLKEVIKNVNYYPDSDILIKGWLKKNNIKKITLN
jgi:DNA polymerase III subunit epsilon